MNGSNTSFTNRAGIETEYDYPVQNIMTDSFTQFDDIRPYRDDEVPAAMKRLAKNELLISTVRVIKWPSCPKPLKGMADILVRFFLNRKLSKIKTVSEFQSKIVAGFLLQWVLKNTTGGVNFSGIDKLDRDKTYIFITNHRDIVLDSALVNYVLYRNGFSIPYIAFGDNLLINEAIADLIRVNNAVIVKRGLPRREQLKAATHLSEYLNKIKREGKHFWISQREGRAKDGIDKTNPAVINMFYLSERKKKQDFSEFVKSCNIVPVAISYEKDPCDRLKGWELYRKHKRGVHLKKKKEDLISMAAGISGDKGRIHLAFGAPLAGDYQDKNELADAIDRSIHTLYKFWPGNYIAYDTMLGTGKYSGQYTESEKENFLSRYRNLKKEVRDLVLKIYANPICSAESHGNDSTH